MVKLKVIKEQDDPLATRISAGGNEEVGNYLVYRGNIEDVKRILMEILYELDTYKNN